MFTQNEERILDWLRQHNTSAFYERTLDAQAVVRFDSGPITREFLQARPSLEARIFPTCFPMNVGSQTFEILMALRSEL